MEKGTRISVFCFRRNSVEMDFYHSQLAVILKVRAMENYCAVLLSSNNITKCFQTTMTRASQMVKEVDGHFGVDLSRTSGPDTIWKNKRGMRVSWRKNVEWLIESMS